MNAGRKNYNVHFIKLPIKIAKAQGKEPPVVDPNGLIYVLHEEEAAIRANDDLKYPLVVRGNIYDCVDWMLTSEWDDDDYDLVDFDTALDEAEFLVTGNTW